jgi:hypothetical protein
MRRLNALTGSHFEEPMCVVQGRGIIVSGFDLAEPRST